MKKDEKRTLSSLPQMDSFPDDGVPFGAKLWAVQVIGNASAKQIGFWIHKNMEVPNESIITEAYEGPSYISQAGTNHENLS